LAAAPALKRAPVSISPPTETDCGAGWNRRSGSAAAARSTARPPATRGRVVSAPKVPARRAGARPAWLVALLPANSKSGKSATVVLQPLRMMLVDQGHDDRALVDAGLDVRRGVDRAANPDVQRRRGRRPEAPHGADVGIERGAGGRIIRAAVPARRRRTEG